ncbi:transposase, partial [Pseudomonas aeruginosa]
MFRAGDGSEKAFTEEQILDFLKQAEAGVPVKELCRR